MLSLAREHLVLCLVHSNVPLSFIFLWTDILDLPSFPLCSSSNRDSFQVSCTVVCVVFLLRYSSFICKEASSKGAKPRFNKVRAICGRAEAWSCLGALQAVPDLPASVCEAGPLSGHRWTVRVKLLREGWYEVGAAQRAVVPTRPVLFVLAWWLSGLVSGGLCGAGPSSDRKTSSVTSDGDSQPPGQYSAPPVRPIPGLLEETAPLTGAYTEARE